ncbi:hypothetical protein Taro_000997 [Colocasia esculenta]|uniref:Uncharacterized protein n=1 Tax=Colocasia esculenta TaxID=4460 RepID=A0A843TGN2_COLES|nr:hypothetical protein [Colocasia esculenta]
MSPEATPTPPAAAGGTETARLGRGRQRCRGRTTSPSGRRRSSSPSTTSSSARSTASDRTRRKAIYQRIKLASMQQK